MLRRGATARGLGAGLSVLSIGATTVALTALGIAAVRAGMLPGPALAVLALTPLAAAELVAGLPDAALRLVTAAPAARRLAELEELPAPVVDPDPPTSVAPPRSLATRALAVRWPGAGHDAVRDVDLTLSPGDRLALTGPSGLREVDGGGRAAAHPPAVGGRRAGRRARRARPDRRRGTGGHRLVRRPDPPLRQHPARQPAAGPPRPPSDADLVDALRRARLRSWFAALPDGLDTMVGEHGGSVSGGERQRIGVARALLADRPVLLFDEPTAHLDPATADDLAAELLAATAGRTALIVTHRPEQTPGLPELRIGDAHRSPAIV